jgi:hypothetical protein
MHIPEDERYGNEEVVTHEEHTEGPVHVAHVD